MASRSEVSGLGELLERLRDTFGRDLSNYRLTCLERRLSLRMAALRMPDVDAYLGYLEQNPDEIEQLLDTVTIHVTEFFRDRAVYDVLSRELIPEIVARALASESKRVRVWSAGCSTGEEVYSIAITFLRYFQAGDVSLALDVFGTDISREACKVARRGRYPARKLEAVPPNLRDRYFEPVGSEYRLAADVRRVVKISNHDLFAPAPFSCLDVIVCRNVLIHFEPSARNGILATFNAALADDGILILGKSEAIAGDATALFEMKDPRNKIYRKRSIRAPQGGRE